MPYNVHRVQNNMYAINVRLNVLSSLFDVYAKLSKKETKLQKLHE